MSLQVNEDSRMSLEGHYWTDRSTRGEIRLTNRRAEILHTYEAANSK
jgi:hypothetical protein